MRIGVLSSPDGWYLRDLQRAAADVPTCASVHGLSFTTLHAALDPQPTLAAREVEDLSQLDTVLVRSMPPGSLEQIVFRMNALHRLAKSGTRVINSPRALEIAIDKYLALAQLQAAGLPVPRTRVTQEREQAMLDYQHLGGDVVVKPMFGSEGRGLVRVTDEAHAWRLFQSLSQLNHVIYQQQYLEHEGADLRVLIVGGHMFGIRRINPQDWRTNVSRGAHTESIDVDDRLQDLAQRAASATETEMAGVDLLPTRDGKIYVLEVNAVPGWRAVAKTLNVDVGRRVLEHCCCR